MNIAWSTFWELCIRIIFFSIIDLLYWYNYIYLCCSHLIGFFIFLALTIYTAMKIPKVVDLQSLQNLPDVLKKADLHKIHSELMTCLPSIPNMSNLQRMRDELKTSFPSLSGWHVMELLTNCLPQRFSHANHTDVCVLVRSLFLIPVSCWC